MQLWKQQAVFLLNVAKLIQYATTEGFYCTGGELHRTEEQAKIYADKGVGIKNSQHCKRLAIDLNLFTEQGLYLSDAKSYAFLGQYWKSLDPKNRWGGDFPNKDGNHFEMKEIC
jgi:hypothetical protein